MKGRLTARRLAVSIAGTLVLLAIAAAVELFLGIERKDGLRLTWLDLGAALADDRSMEAQIFFVWRLPRALAAALAGAGLAAAGVAFQAILRNPLADAYTLGVSPGAGLGAVIAIRLGLDTMLGSTGVAAYAFGGAIAVVLVIWRISNVGAFRPPAMLVLAGITLAFLCSAGSMFLQYTATFIDSTRIVRWMMGGLTAVPKDDLLKASVVVALGLGVLLAFARDLNALAAGEEAAASVGVAVNRVVRVSFGAASAVVAAIVAVAGPIGFVGIVVPHALRAIVGPDHRVLLPTSIIGGAAFVLLADAAARILQYPTEIPVGIITALVGGTFFLALLMSHKSRARLWGG